jgi:RimJ/RimL family protein N-acetyltransferase
MKDNNYQKISFRKAAKNDLELLKAWFNKPHVKEFWDNSKEMWENVESYLNGHKVLYDYWIGLFEKAPFCLIITSDASEKDLSEKDLNAPGSDNNFLPYLEPHGKTWTIDFMIGEESFLGRGLSHIALLKFTDDQRSVCSFLIDPAASNTKAIHIYEKAGFKKIATFIPKEGYFASVEHILMKKNQDTIS